MRKALIFLVFTFIYFWSPSARAQNLTKDAMNAFAHFTKTQDIKQLETARKNIDQAYKTAKDSVSRRNNLIRAMIYSALAVVDSNRNFSYTRDPLQEASFSLSRIKQDKFSLEHEPEIEFIKNQLARAYLYEANNALEYSNYEEAANAFSMVDSLESGNLNITHNLAMLYEKVGATGKAILAYRHLIDKRPEPAYYFNLSELYLLKRNPERALQTLQEGRSRFPKDQDLVFKEINFFAEKQDYATVVRLLPNALKLDEHSLPLNYLAGFSYEVLGDTAKAEEHYEKVLNSDQNNFDANYALGLLYLNSYLKNQAKKPVMYNALHHISKANEIDPNHLKTLQSLAILYQLSGDIIQLQRVNNKINQIKLN